MNGFLNLLKPPGMSSAAAVGLVKRLSGARVGHAGTLDPEACGVLPVMVGKATRLLPYFEDKGKEYIAQICFSCATDTQDAQGRMTEPGRGMPSEDELLAVLPAFMGDILQRPPAYSALKRDGQPLYALARQGKTVETEPRPVRVDEIELLHLLAPLTAVLRVRCGGGTYIRTLCHDIGQRLGRPAHMRLLIRTRSGCFALAASHTVEEVQRAAEAGALSSLLAPMDTPVASLRAVSLSGKALRRVLNGVRLPLSSFPVAEGERVRLLGDGELIGLGEGRNGLLDLPLLLTDQVDFLSRHPHSSAPGSAE